MSMSIRSLLVALAVALLAASCSDEGNVFSLEVGTCFQDVEAGEVFDVPIVGCDEAHDNQVYATWDIQGGSLPIGDEMNEGCFDRFEAAIGVPYEDSAIFASPLVPTLEGFNQGDKEVVCYAFEVNEDGTKNPVTGTLLGANR